MKSQKGVTMISLVLYVASFLVITSTIGAITTFFYNNVEVLDTSVGSSSAYNKLNLCMLNECKKQGSELFAWRNDSNEIDDNTLRDTPNNLQYLSDPSYKSNSFITFIDAYGNKNSIIYSNNKLYYNYIILCDDVDSFKFKIDYASGKTVLKVFAEIKGVAYTTEYVVNSINNI